MYKSEKKKFSLIKIALVIIALFFIIFILIWLSNKAKSKSSISAFAENFNKMQEVSENYFETHLPEDDDSKIVTLEDMYDLKLINKLTLNNKECDKEKSYSYIIKTENNKYAVTTNLVCGNQKDTKTIILSETKQEEQEEKQDDKCDCNCKCECNCDINCNIKSDGTVCRDVTTYEYTKTGSNTCPSGYSYKNGKCQKTITDEKSVKTITKTVNAKTSSKTEKTYTNVIVTTTPGSKYCTSGSLVNGKCVSSYSTAASKAYTDWSNPIKNYSVSKPESTYTNEYEKKVETGRNTALGIYTYAIYTRSSYYYCNSGSLSGSSCVVTTTTDAKTNPSTTTYSCPSGYTKEGSGSSTKCYKTVSIGSYYCENKNATLKGDKCYTYETSCDAGYSLNKNKCVKQTTIYSDIIPGKTEVIWSEKTSLSGYTKTGASKTQTICKKG